MEDLVNEIRIYLQTYRVPLLIALLGAMVHVFFTKSNFKEVVLKFVSAFVGALLIAPAITEYFELSIKLNNVIVLVVSLGTYYILKAVIKIFSDISEDPKNYFFDVWSKIRSNQNK